MGWILLPPGLQAKQETASALCSTCDYCNSCTTAAGVTKESGEGGCTRALDLDLDGTNGLCHVLLVKMVVISLVISGIRWLNPPITGVITYLLPSGNLLQFAIEHSPFIVFTVDLPMKNGDVPWQTVSLPEGILRRIRTLCSHGRIFYVILQVSYNTLGLTGTELYMNYYYSIWDIYHQWVI